jgi:hypothetical protein
MNSQVLFDRKWVRFLRRIWLFRHIPFVDFVLAAGSMALGNVRPESDFDVIVGARSGRIFTARFCCWLIFGLFGWRRKKQHGPESKDKICFNHFVTEKSYRLSPPYNRYWQDLYFNLVPVFGSSEIINEFFQANADWMGGKKNYQDDLRHHRRSPSLFKIILERLGRGMTGNWLEKIFKNAQIKRIERGLKTERSYQPRIIYSDAELEFHPDTYRTTLWS